MNIQFTVKKLLENSLPQLHILREISPFALSTWTRTGKSQVGASRRTPSSKGRIQWERTDSSISRKKVRRLPPAMCLPVGLIWRAPTLKAHLNPTGGTARLRPPRTRRTLSACCPWTMTATPHSAGQRSPRLTLSQPSRCRWRWAGYRPNRPPPSMGSISS